MSTLENLANPNYRPPTGPQCGIAMLMPALDKKTQDLLKAAMQNAYAPSTAIAQAMSDQGHRVSAHTVQRHRRGECRCARES